ncbi:hypothetical protein DPMN_089157 [Dreissena polymorpha]|uniref:Uncharacterized protein n=1 Tax=Dreissena polymorpha TaxID=45954 RepID=A0A9D4KXP2_DREPO|nr:hypothetical protein DPMN_089157 [Dreissena polymorpha]
MGAVLNKSPHNIFGKVNENPIKMRGKKKADTNANASEPNGKKAKPATEENVINVKEKPVQLKGQKKAEKTIKMANIDYSERRQSQRLKDKSLLKTHERRQSHRLKEKTVLNSSERRQSQRLKDKSQLKRKSELSTERKRKQLEALL